MAKATVSPLDPAKVAAGIGSITEGRGYARVVVEGKTLAYIKRSTVTVPAALVAKAPKRLGEFKTETNGRWAGVAVAGSDKARAVLEYVALKAGQA
jgi:hypothetical protein